MCDKVSQAVVLFNHWIGGGHTDSVGMFFLEGKGRGRVLQGWAACQIIFLLMDFLTYFFFI